MNRRNILGGLIASAGVAVLAKLGQQNAAAADTVTVPAEGEWVYAGTHPDYFGAEQVYVDRSRAYPRITWTGYYNDTGEFVYEELLSLPTSDSANGEVTA